MKKVLDFFKGKKTYLCALGVGAVSVLLYLGYITEELAVMLYGLLGAGSVAAVRAGVSKIKV